MDYDVFKKMFHEGASTSCEASTWHEDPLTMDKIKEAIQKLEEIPCMFKTYMIEQGFDPKDNCYMLLPIRFREEKMFQNLPPYVKLTKTVAEPTLIRVPNNRTYQPVWDRT